MTFEDVNDRSKRLIRQAIKNIADDVKQSREAHEAKVRTAREKISQCKKQLKCGHDMQSGDTFLFDNFKCTKCGYTENNW